jgi:predicted NBD/HSP70 family sugar kinase
VKQEAGNQKLVRSTNQRLIIDLVRKKGLISRAELAKSIKLSAPSVSSNIESLMALDLIKEVGSGELMGIGRPPILLEFNKEFGYIICIDLTTEDIRIALGDLQGVILSEQHISISLEKKIKKDIFRQIIDCISTLLNTQKIPESRLKAICVGTPGIINRETGFFQLAPRFENWEKLNIKQIIEERFQTNIIVVNDVNLAIIGENHFGAGRGFRNLVSMNIDVGIGAAIILEGNLYEGSRFAAGEIGYWISGLPQVDQDGQVRWNNLDTLISLHNIKLKIKKDLKQGKAGNLHKYFPNEDSVNLESFRRALEDEDPYCMQIIKDMVKQLAVAIANIIIFLDVELIVLAGEISKLGTFFLNPLQELVNLLIPLSTKISYSELGDRAGIYGGFTVALDYVMSHILDNSASQSLGV